jgi:hypothetical protein
MTYASIQSAGSWRPLRHCPGRSIWEGASDRRPSDLVGAVVAVRVFRVPTAADPVHVAALDAGGLISYEKADGRFVHTLNTPEGFARKLEQLGIGLERAKQEPGEARPARCDRPSEESTRTA